jgi:tetratricopeptide (TPR) repeat protein
LPKSILRLLATAALSCAFALPAQAQNSSAGAYLAARSASFVSDYDSAARFYARLVAEAPNNAFLLENALLANLSLGRMDMAVPLARKLESVSDDSQIANMLMLVDDVSKGRYAAVLERISAEKGIGALVDGLGIAWAQLGAGDMNAALAAFDQVAAERGYAGFALYHKALALASVGNFEAAEAIYAGDAASSVQVTRRGAMAHIEVLSQMQRNEDALVVLEALFGRDLDPQLRAMRTALETGETLPFTLVRSAQDGIAEVAYTIAGALENEASPDYTLLYTRMAEFLRPDHVDALLLSAELLEELGQYDLATETYKSVPAGHFAFHSAELGRADALRRSGKVEAAIEVLEQLARTHGDLPIVHTTLGDILRQQNAFADAAAAYDRALDLYGTPDDSQWFTYYARGISYERQGKWAEAETDFRKALDLNPDQPQVLNYLGYSLVEKRIKLDEALSMIERAVAARPDSGYIVDSLGWVLYRLGRYEEAVGHMERATELMPVDPVVNDHLGDVYWAVGRKTEAEFQWMRALSFIDENAPPEADPDRIRRKLEVGLDEVLIEEGAAPLQVANDG